MASPPAQDAQPPPPDAPRAAQSPDDAAPDYELLSPIGYANSSKCGYCGTSSSQSRRYSYYATATSLSPQFYQKLLDRCWRRSGTLLYRPNPRRACCPHYTIRLDSTQFKPSRDQRQCVNRFNRFVLGDAYAREAARLHPATRQEARRRDNVFCLTQRVHEAEHARVRRPPEPAHAWTVTLEDDCFTEEKYRVYANYQHVVHGEAPEDRTRRSFRRFLCSSPLRRQVVAGPAGEPRHLGSFHQCYRIDGELVAVGVLDILPDCVSSVYFLYHESIHRHTPGKLGALYEIALAVERGHRWWYPGFYIHGCAKMRYKTDYAPQFLLDPHSLAWDPLDDEALAFLDRNQHVSLALERQARRSAAAPAPADDAPDAPRPDARPDGGICLFESDMPGIPSLADMERVDMDYIPLKISSAGPLFEVSDLVNWDATTIRDWPSAKASMAELVAALGVDLVGSICIDSSSR